MAVLSWYFLCLYLCIWIYAEFAVIDYYYKVSSARASDLNVENRSTLEGGFYIPVNSAVD